MFSYALNLYLYVNYTPFQPTFLQLSLKCTGGYREIAAGVIYRGPINGPKARKNIPPKQLFIVLRRDFV